MKSISIKPCKRVITKSFSKKKNGFLLEIASSLDNWSKFLDNAQVYLSTVKPKQKKGFHLHHLKENQFTCIKGKVVMAVWDGKKIKEYKMGEENYITVRVPKELAICFYNYGKDEAYIINLCSPPYDPKVKEQEDLDIPWQPKI